jgi:hypothetical protein
MSSGFGRQGPTFGVEQPDNIRTEIANRVDRNKVWELDNEIVMDCTDMGYEFSFFYLLARKVPVLDQDVLYGLFLDDYLLMPKPKKVTDRK